MGAKHITPRVLMGQRRTPGEMARVSSLLRLARGEFGRLARADRKVIVAAALGEVADFSGLEEDYLEYLARARQSEALAVQKDRARGGRSCSDFSGEPPVGRPRPPVELRPELLRWLICYSWPASSSHSLDLIVRGARIDSPLILTSCTLQGNLELRDCTLVGLRVRDAKCKSLILDGSFVAEAKLAFGRPFAIDGDRAHIAGSVFLRDGFLARGEVHLIGARIDESVSVRGGSFVNPGTDEHGKPRYALSLTRTVIGETLFTREIGETQGIVSFKRCRAGHLNDLPPGAGDRLDRYFPRQVLLNGFVYGGLLRPATEARLALLRQHDETARLINSDEPLDPQPYRQLSEVLKRQGLDAEARSVLFEYEKRQADLMYELGRIRVSRWRRPSRLRQSGALRAALGFVYRNRARAPRQRVRRAVSRLVFGIGRHTWQSRWAFGWAITYRRSVGFGFKRFRILWALVIFLILGFFVFRHQSGRRMQPTQMLALREFESAHVQNGASAAHAGGELTRRYPKFNALIYSADALIPLVSFHQEDYWTPRGDPAVHSIGSWWRTGGWWSGRWWTKVYLVFHISMGWVIATLFAASFTRLMRHD